MDSAFSALEKLNSRGMKFGTEETARLLKALGSPESGLKIVHIAGTNGKGSVAEYISQILIADGKKTGVFTSPAVYSQEEQIRVNGEPLSPQSIKNYIDSVMNVANGETTSFEALTAAALVAFEKEGCEYAVIECGLGGKLDATNAIKNKELALIASIGKEHTRYLGDSIQSICEHKAGIISNCPAVASALQPPEALAFFKKRGIYIADKPIKILKSELSGQQFTYGGEEFSIKMNGFAQPYNAALAIEGARILKVGENAIKNGLATAFLGGRIEYIKRGKGEYILDGGHNPSGTLPLANFIRESFGGKKTLIYGCLSDKDIDGNLKPLEGLFEDVICVRPDSPRAMDGDRIVNTAKKYFDRVRMAESLERALISARGRVVVSGSFTLLKEAREWIEKRS